MRQDNNSLAHTTWNCKYHIVFFSSDESEARESLLEVRSLSKKFQGGERFFFAPPRWLHAVRGVDFSIRQGSVVLGFGRGRQRIDGSRQAGAVQAGQR